MPTNEQPESSIKPTLHPVYIVTNIQHKVRILDGIKVTYSSWVKLFKLHAKGYKVLHHIDGIAAPKVSDATYESWSEIDAIVLQWIYGTLSDNLLVRILEPDTTSYEAWKKLSSIFLNNKGSRAAALQHEFNNLKLSSMTSLEEYCQRLKDLASQLDDVENPVTENRLVLQLVRGLPSEFDTMASFINQSLPTGDTACSMLQLEQHRQSSRESNNTTENSSGGDLVATHTNIADEPTPPHQNRRPRSNQNCRPMNTGNRGRGGNNTRDTRGRGAPSGNHNIRPPGEPPGNALYSYWAAYAPPPCPFPARQGWVYPWNYGYLY
ncbi:unnamed protein product [Lactuca virosa]|uniref:Retrotransposon gag domain-containing protein n=1 Tax=Lactuca virosa TaxID=75947 RepID=A0AAU9M0P4_9ASTR|nr:unnamed protein product [Lactuca virosa]